MALKALSLFIAVTAARSWECGVDHPEFGRLLNVEPIVQAQKYETPEMVERARRLAATDPGLERLLARNLQQSQSYTDANPFVPLRVVHANGDSRPIRIKIVWDVVQGNDDDFLVDNGSGGYTRTSISRQCSNVGQVISVKTPTTYSGWRDDYTCASAAVASVGTARYDLMKKRTEAAVQYWTGTLNIKPVQDAITVPSAADNVITVNFGIAPGTSYTDADLVLIMTARPSPDSPIAGFAICYQKDQRGRCTIGQFNWVPEVLNLENKDSADTIESELHTALHELMHVLGGMGPGIDADGSIFLDDSGNKKSGSNVFTVEEDPVYADVTAALRTSGAMVNPKMRTLISTPKVVEVTRTWLGCDTANGFPLEDVPLGKGSHWEARVAGPEFMSYGSGSGQIYISDLSLAFLEDTGQYIPEYRNAGPILSTGGTGLEDDIAAGKVTITTDNTGNPDYQPPKPLPPGALRWGMGEGCKFLNEKPGTAWPDVYKCSVNRDYACTPDGRMSAVCIVKSDWTQVPRTPSCGRYVQMTSTSNYPQYGPLCEAENDNAPANGYGPLPTWMQYYSTDAAAATAAGVSAATKATTGGYNDAMDYVPVNVGYWNCMYAKPSDNTTGTKAGEYGLTLDSVASYFGSMMDIDQFGGQIRGPQSRCFKSSLMELSKIATLNPAFPAYGLCYRTNCYRPDYLQVAVKAVIGGASQWLKCPTEGGKLYIPGFAGALSCPRAVDFCKHENITGAKYPETDIVTEAIFWGVLITGGLLFASFLTCPCLRNRIINCSKRCCGARVFEDDVTKQARQAAKARDDRDVELPDPTPLPVCASRTLFGVNIFTLLLGLAIIGLTSYSVYLAKVYSFAVSMVGLGLLIVILSGMGVCSSRARAEFGPSCWVLAYFFVDLLLCCLLLWGIAYNLAYADFDTYVDKYYDVIADAIPADLIRNQTRSEAVHTVGTYIESNMGAVAGLAIATMAVFVINLVAAGRIISGRILTSITITFINNVIMMFGTMMTVIGWYLFSKRDNAAGAESVIFTVIAMGMTAMAVCGLGYYAVHKRRVDVLAIYITFHLLLLGLTAAIVWACFTQSAKVIDFVSAQDDKKLGAVASSLGLAVTKTTLIQQIKNNLQQLALAFVVVLVLQVLLVLNCIFFIRGVKSYNAEHGLSLWGKPLPGGAVPKAPPMAGAPKVLGSPAGRGVVSSKGPVEAPQVMVLQDNRLRPQGRPSITGHGGPGFQAVSPQGRPMLSPQPPPGPKVAAPRVLRLHPSPICLATWSSIPMPPPAPPAGPWPRPPAPPQPRDWPGGPPPPAPAGRR